MNLKLPYNRELEVINIKYLYNDNIKYLIPLLGTLQDPLQHYKTKYTFVGTVTLLQFSASYQAQLCSTQKPRFGQSRTKPKVLKCL